MKKIVLNYRTTEKRAAIFENERLVELFSEGKEPESIVGNIYKGRVVKVVPGMQAAFVNIGLNKNGFLQKDQLVSFRNLQPSQKEKASIASLIHEGQEIIVQVSKDEFGEKGPRLTTLIEIPGRFVVYLPNDAHISVSKKMNEEERDGWRSFGKATCSGTEGLVFRTACSGQLEQTIREEIDYLQNKWSAIEKEQLANKAPTILFDNSSLEEQVLRDLLSVEQAEMIVDDGEFFRKMKERLAILKYDHITLHQYMGKENIFSKYGIDQEIEQMLRPFVLLKNGASLMIEQTEAMTVIDVNSGKFTGKNSAQETIVKTNELAAIEIARQLRLRNIGGIVLIDFINMDGEKNRDYIKKIFSEALKADRSHTRIYGFTQLGLLEMTRKKERKSQLEQLTITCPTCNGLGRVYTTEQIVNQIERTLWEYKGMDQEAIWVEVPLAVEEKLKTTGYLNDLEQILGFTLFITGSDTSVQSFAVRHVGTKNDILNRLPK